MMTTCAHCGFPTRTQRKTATRVAAVIGGLAGFAQAWRVNRCAESLATAAAGGFALGATLGAAIDEHVLRQYRCRHCGFKSSD